MSTLPLYVRPAAACAAASLCLCPWLSRYALRRATSPRPALSSLRLCAHRGAQSTLPALDAGQAVQDMPTSQLPPRHVVLLRHCPVDPITVAGDASLPRVFPLSRARRVRVWPQRGKCCLRPLSHRSRSRYTFGVSSHPVTPRHVPTKSRLPHPIASRRARGAYPRSATAGSVREPA
jgi:hypothetical protein